MISAIEPVEKSTKETENTVAEAETDFTFENNPLLAHIHLYIFLQILFNSRPIERLRTVQNESTYSHEHYAKYQQFPYKHYYVSGKVSRNITMVSFSLPTGHGHVN